ncbi:MAG: class I SAM-dependent methyltransferase, partial [Candidatus Zixiibacteriota bacterium]
MPNQIDRQAESLFMNLFANTGEVHIRKKHDARKKKITITADQIITSSDPGGILFTKNNQILRAIIPPKERFYRSLLAEPQRKLLIDAGLVETEITAYYTDTYPLIVKHAQLPLITYPFEWVSENLKQSALFFCAFWKKLAALGFGLKDAHGYNIVYDYGNNPCFIDFCSIIPLQEAPLVCEEFNRYFLNPLYFLKVGQQSQMRHLVNLGGYETGKKRGGIDDQEVLPLLPSQLKKKYLYYREKEHFYRKEISSHSLVELYEEEINGICVEIKETCWATYYDVSSQYPTNVRFGNLEPDEAWQPKQKFLYDLLSNHPGQTVLDIGCSAGWFSRLAAKLGKHVLAMDNDESSLERVYRYARRENLTIHPIFCDFSKLNSLYPKQGTRNIKKRFKSDIVLALAVVHHLVFRENMTFGSIARLLHTVTKDTLVVEFIDNNDRSIKDIMMKEKKVPWYTGDNFKLELGKYFKKINIVDSTGNFARYLLVCTGKIPKPDNVSEIINTTAEDNNRLLDSQTKDKMEKSALSPISRQFGFDRGKPIDRYYIENFLNENKHFIRGRVLEIGDNSYTKKYGSAV